MKKKTVITAALVTAVVAMGNVSVFAAENYSYMEGRQRSQSRNAIYAQAETIESEAEREAFLEANGISETEWSEEAAASFSYVTGQQRGASYRTEDSDGNENSDMSSYSYLTGQQRGSSYSR